MHSRSACHDPSAMSGRAMRGHTGQTSGLAAIGDVFWPAASIVLGQPEAACTPLMAILLATLGR